MSPAATFFTGMFRSAHSASFVRGLTTNVTNYNMLNAAQPGPDEACRVREVGAPYDLGLGNEIKCGNPVVNGRS
ncbi:hypothetical protein GSI_13320 [Ganoderma sinense ZZ0214-1]|uniref:Uncharacterized protein n=1 Tax=Ganoderma sinense ZZ0214-1 TaxID=1077348 RepID=A0A2G8RV89_9APHY|nr:hypothetical protein GSI_13320 [Ganoderma sinense ZZ0214-1]